jgi:membrane associated rhomboid family serine protease
MLVVVTGIVSFLAFNNQQLSDKLILWPRAMHKPEEYYRLLTSGFIHGDIAHLLFNMISLFFVGSYVEQVFAMFSNKNLYLLLYLGGIVVASLPSFVKHRNDPYYRSLGASGGVSAVIFSLVYLAPWVRLSIFFLPMPGIVFAVLYVVYSIYMSRRGQGPVNHDAHLWGALFGFVFTFICDPTHGFLFISQLTEVPPLRQWFAP